MTKQLAAIVMVLAWVAAGAEQPRVVKATPDNGATDVDPNTKQIVVVFDQPMNKRGRSIVGGGPSFPKLGQIRWTNDRTIVMDVQLEPDHDYWLSINSQTFTNFRSTKGEPAVPYPIAFRTAGGAKLTVDVQKNSIEQLRKAIDDNYSYRDLRGVDWDKLFAENAPKLEKCETAGAFAQQAGAMLADAKDIHLFLQVGQTTYPSFVRKVPGNVNLRLLPRLVPNLQPHAGDRVAVGRFEDGIVYVLISTWSRDIADDLDPVYAAFGEADAGKGIIIDVRNNAGGDEPLAQQVAGCFVDSPKVYSKNTIRRDGQWEGPYDRVVGPNKARPAYRGKVVVLMGQYCMSSNESFLLMMRAAGATLVGAKSYGSSGNPRPVDLANGVTVFLPSWKDMLPDGECLEGQGVSPDVEVSTQPKDFEQSDPVLDAGLKVLRGQKVNPG